MKKGKIEDGRRERKGRGIMSRRCCMSKARCEIREEKAERRVGRRRVEGKLRDSRDKAEWPLARVC